MSLTKTNLTKSSITQQDKERLEYRLYSELKKGYVFKDLACFFAILKQDPQHVVFGGFQDVVGKIQYDFSERSTFESTVRKIFANSDIKIETKTARDEATVVKKRIAAKIAKDKKNAEIQELINKQIEEGRCDLIPFPLMENKVRSDLTIERHALFAANTFKGDFRVFEKEIIDYESNKKVTLRIEIGDKNGKVKGVLKQKHQESFYKLSQIWAEQEYCVKKDEGEIHGSIKLTVYDLVKRLRGEDGGKAYAKVFDLLRDMSTILVKVVKIDSDKNTTTTCYFTLLSFEWKTKHMGEYIDFDNQNTESKVYIKFSNYITENFLKKNVKSLMLSPYLGLKDRGRKGVAQLLYTMLDYELATKPKFNISLISLCVRLGLSQYKYKYDRKRALSQSIKNLNGKKILNSEFLLNVYLEESANKKDWIFVARKIKDDG